MLEAHLALSRRYWSHDENLVLIAQTNVAVCLSSLERLDETLILRREIYAKMVALFGVSHEGTIIDGLNLASSMVTLNLWDEGTSFLRDQLLPPARQSLGSNHHATLNLEQNLAVALYNNPESTCMNGV